MKWIPFLIILLLSQLRAEPVPLRDETIQETQQKAQLELLLEVMRHGKEFFLSKDHFGTVTPVLVDARSVIQPLSIGMVVVGIFFCFFGWTFYQVGTRVIGLFVGALLGGVLGAIPVFLASKAVPQNDTGAILLIALSLLILPGLFLGGRLGWSSATGVDRFSSLGGLGDSPAESALSLIRFFHFEWWIIGSYAFFGLLLLFPGLFMGSVSALSPPDQHLHPLLFASLFIGLLLGGLGIRSQLNRIRSAPGIQGKMA